MLSYLSYWCIFFALSTCSFFFPLFFCLLLHFLYLFLYLHFSSRFFFFFFCFWFGFVISISISLLTTFSAILIIQFADFVLWNMLQYFISIIFGLTFSILNRHLFTQDFLIINSTFFMVCVNIDVFSFDSVAFLVV